MCGIPTRKFFVEIQKSELVGMYKTKVFNRGTKRNLQMKVAGKTENLQGIMK